MLRKFASDTKYWRSNAKCKNELCTSNMPSLFVEMNHVDKFSAISEVEVVFSVPGEEDRDEKCT